MKAFFKEGDILEDLYPSRQSRRFLRIKKITTECPHDTSRSKAIIYYCDYGGKPWTINTKNEDPIRRTQKYLRSFCRQVKKESELSYKGVTMSKRKIIYSECKLLQDKNCLGTDSYAMLVFDNTKVGFLASTKTDTMLYRHSWDPMNLMLSHYIEVEDDKLKRYLFNILKSKLYPDIADEYSEPQD